MRRKGHPEKGGGVEKVGGHIVVTQRYGKVFVNRQKWRQGVTIQEAKLEKPTKGEAPNQILGSGWGKKE